MNQTPVLYIVIPCYNEQEALPITAERLTALTDDMLSKKLIAPESRVLLVDDGSRDATWRAISELHAKSARFEGAKLAHNVGHMRALWAGMTLASEKCDCLISIDADLQDDINAMYGFLEAYAKGADVVYGVRSSRGKDTFFKRTTAEGYYYLMNKLGVEMVPDHAEYRLLSKRALLSLLDFGEVNMFLRGMVPMLGYKTEKVYYERGERVAGESKYPLRKMIAFAVEGITSLSFKPIGLIAALGVLCVLCALVLACVGTGAVLASLWFLGGLILLALGVIGEYIGKVYMETKRRPKFILETYLSD